MIVEIHSTEEGLLVLLENDDVSAQVLIKIFIYVNNITIFKFQVEFTRCVEENDAYIW